MRTKIAICLVTALLGWAAASAQITGFDGEWDISAQYGALLEQGTVTCMYSGTAQIDGGSGPVNLDLTSTDPVGQSDACESALNGEATIEEAGSDSISGTIKGADNLGTAAFTGRPVEATARAATSIQSGTVTPDPDGPFAGATGGGFSATLRAPVPILPPALMGLLLFLLIGGGGLLLLRRRTA